jgi:hypothetical protein
MIKGFSAEFRLYWGNSSIGGRATTLPVRPAGSWDAPALSRGTSRWFLSGDDFFSPDAPVLGPHRGWFFEPGRDRSRTLALPGERFLGALGPASNIANWRCYFLGSLVPEALAVASFAPSTPSNIAKKAQRSKPRPRPGRVFTELALHALFEPGCVRQARTELLGMQRVKVKLIRQRCGDFKNCVRIDLRFTV